ncbi:nucleotidyl transferase AbiEii/AbiGii toxin family protein [Oceanobacillus locisalsi]|uniref:Nucleotidyl transferase AbiEii/AbiGii toxin family protein n=1 Tax=Oceanobacillus locisalsi TaxID=546107 RepID=A0ABW3NDD3_9BACI
MNLHKHKSIFQEIAEAASDEFNLLPFQVEKDYFVSLFLKNLQEVAPNIVFKGGTSLSKCYDVIRRFSEDIDLTIDFNQDKLTSGTLRRTQEPLKKSIKETGDKLGFTLLNDEPIRTGRLFNKYKLGYNPVYTDEYDWQILDHILVETMLAYKPFPCEVKPVSNYITKFLERENLINFIDDYYLHSFSMRIQSIDRTFLDKLLAICDYHLDKNYSRNSRHIYDIHMIYKSNLVDTENLLPLLTQVIETRRTGKKTYSSKAGFKLFDVLQEIMNDAVYKEDYETNTSEFLSEYVDYETSIQSLHEIVTKEWLPNEIPEDPANLLKF